MLSFKEYLQEVRLFFADKNGSAVYMAHTMGLGRRIEEDDVLLGKIVDDSYLYLDNTARALQYPASRVLYLIVRNKKVVAGIVTYKEGRASQTKLAVSTDENKVPMHKIYAHLIKKRGLILQSDSAQTPGGKNIWAKLSKEPGITVHGWDPKTEKPINLGNYLDDTVATHVTGKEKDEEDAEYLASIDRMVLIGHKKYDINI